MKLVDNFNAICYFYIRRYIVFLYILTNVICMELGREEEREETYYFDYFDSVGCGFAGDGCFCIFLTGGR